MLLLGATPLAASGQTVDVYAQEVDGGQAREEGAWVGFEVVRGAESPGFDEPLTVNVRITETGNMMPAQVKARRSLVIMGGHTIGYIDAGTIDDLVEESDSQVTFSIQAGAGYRVVSPSSVRVTVKDNDEGAEHAQPEVSISAQSASLTRGQTAVFRISRTGPATESVTVNVEVSQDDGSNLLVGTPGSSVTLARGSRSTTLRVPTSSSGNAGSIHATVLPGEGYIPAIGVAASIAFTVPTQQRFRPTVSFHELSASIQVGQPAQFTLHRDGPVDAELEDVRISMRTRGLHCLSTTPPSTITATFPRYARSIPLNDRGFATAQDNTGCGGEVVATIQSGSDYQLGSTTTKTVRVIGVTIDTLSMRIVNPDSDPEVGGIQINEGEPIQIAFARSGALQELTLPITIEETGSTLARPEDWPTEVHFADRAAGAILTIPTVNDTTNELHSRVDIYVDKDGNGWRNHGGPGSNRLRLWVNDNDFGTIGNDPGTIGTDFGTIGIALNEDEISHEILVTRPCTAQEIVEGETTCYSYRYTSPDPNEKVVGEGRTLPLTITRTATVHRCTKVRIQAEHTGLMFSGLTSIHTYTMEGNQASRDVTIRIPNDGVESLDGRIRARLLTSTEGCEGEARQPYHIDQLNFLTDYIRVVDNDNSVRFNVAAPTDLDEEACTALNCTPRQGLLEGRNAVFTITPSSGYSDKHQDVTVRWEIRTDSYTIRGERDLTFANNDAKRIALSIPDDGKNNTFGIVRVWVERNGPVRGNGVTLPLLENRSPGGNTVPQVSITRVSSPVTEGEAAKFRISRTGTTTIPLNLRVWVSASDPDLLAERECGSGNPNCKIEYQPTIEVGERSLVVDVNTVSDDRVEPSYNVTAQLAESIGIRVVDREDDDLTDGLDDPEYIEARDSTYAVNPSQASATVVINDNTDAHLPTIQAERVGSPDLEYREGTPLRYRIRRIGGNREEITVKVEVADPGGRTTGEKPTEHTLPAGASHADFELTVEDDTAVQADADVRLTIKEDAAYRIQSGRVLRWRISSDGDPYVTVDLDETVVEGERLKFRIARFNRNGTEPSQLLWRAYTDNDTTAIAYIDDDTTSNADFHAVPESVLTFTHEFNTVYPTVRTMVNNVTTDRTFKIEVKNDPSNASPVWIKTAEGTYAETMTWTITIEERNPRITITPESPVEVTEGETATVTLRLKKAYDEELKLRWRTGHSELLTTDTPRATAGTDYQSFDVSGSSDNWHELTFSASETEKTIEVDTYTDEQDDSNEWFAINIVSHEENSRGIYLGATGSSTAATVRVKIINDGPLPKSWVAEYGHAFGTTVLDAVAARMHGTEKGPWGQAFSREFSGSGVEGRLRGGLTGLDTDVNEDLVAGMAIATGEAEGTFDEYELEGQLTGAYPYLRWESGPELVLWGTAGAASGRIKIRKDDLDTTARMRSRLIAVGSRSLLMSDARWSLTNANDTAWIASRSSNSASMRGARAISRRVRSEIAASYTLDWNSVTLTPSSHVAIEYNGGDIDTRTDRKLGARLDAQYDAYGAAIGVATTLAGDTSKEVSLRYSGEKLNARIAATGDRVNANFEYAGLGGGKHRGVRPYLELSGNEVAGGFRWTKPGSGLSTRVHQDGVMLSVELEF